MLLKILLIALIVYVIVVTRARVRLPHPGLQATVDVLQAATLRDEHVVATARRFVEYADAQQPALPAGDPYAERLERLTSRYAAVNGVPLNFRVYRTPQVNAFATADGSIRIYSGLMDRMSDDELMAIVGHEMGHIRNSDSLGAMRKACLTSAIRNTLGAAGGVIGALSSSQWGALAERLTSAGFSRKQEYAADDFAFGFLLRNGYDPYAMATALDKLARLASAEQGAGKELLQLFSTHPDSAERARRMREKADAAHGARFRNGGFQERVMKNFIITVVFIVTTSISFAQSEPETAGPLTDMEIVRKVAFLDIERKSYENVVISFKSVTPDYLISDKYRVKVKVLDENGKSIYKKTFRNVFLYVFSDGQVQVGQPTGKKKSFNQIIITKSASSDDYVGMIREKEGIY